jgi:hypothetical protein
MLLLQQRPHMKHQLLGWHAGCHSPGELFQQQRPVTGQ